MKLDGNQVSMLDQSIQNRLLTKSELMQLSRPLSDTFDPAFNNITVFIPACNCLQTMDLFERDSSFADQFDTTYTFEELMEELEDGRYDKEDLAFEIIAAELQRHRWTSLHFSCVYYIFIDRQSSVQASSSDLLSLRLIETP